MLTGWDEPGEPFTYASSIYTAPGQGSTSGLAPQAQSYVTMDGSSAWQRSDLAALARSDVAACFKIEQASPTWGLVKAIGSAAHGSLSWTPFRRMPAAVIVGVSAVAYQTAFGISTAKLTAYLSYSFVIMGAGRVEEALVFQGSSEYPVSGVLVRKISTELEQRLVNSAASQ